jgi:hypothetical protein
MVMTATEVVGLGARNIRIVLRGNRTGIDSLTAR